MANPFTKGWKYLMTSFDQKIDESADPKVQIQQAVDGAKKQHQEISEQAASVIGNKKQLEMQLNRLLKSQEEYQERTRSALQQADQAATQGDAEQSSKHNNNAELIASQLVAVEQELEQTKTLYAQAEQAAEQAQNQQKESEARLKEQLSEVDKLMAQADQADMQQKSADAMESMDTSVGKPDGNVPTLDSVRSKIERRYADALGSQELMQDTANDRISEIASSGTDMRATSRLDEIRASMKQDQKSVTSGDGAADEQSDAAEAPEKDPGKDSEKSD